MRQMQHLGSRHPRELTKCIGWIMNLTAYYSIMAYRQIYHEFVDSIQIHIFFGVFAYKNCDFSTILSKVYFSRLYLSAVSNAVRLKTETVGVQKTVFINETSKI